MSFFKSNHTVLLQVNAAYYQYSGGMRGHVHSTFYIAGKDEEDALKRLEKHIRKELVGDNIEANVISRVYIGGYTDSREIFVP